MYDDTNPNRYSSPDDAYVATGIFDDTLHRVEHNPPWQEPGSTEEARGPATPLLPKRISTRFGLYSSSGTMAQKGKVLPSIYEDRYKRRTRLPRGFGGGDGGNPDDGDGIYTGSEDGDGYSQYSGNGSGYSGDNGDGGGDGGDGDPGRRSSRRYPKKPPTVSIEKFKPKCDTKTFPLLSAISHFYKWYRTSRATARAHQLGEMFDPSYAPIYLEEAIEFEKKLAFFYHVLMAIVKEAACYDIVMKYEENFDAQKCMKELVNYYMTSTEAILANRAERGKIASLRYNPSEGEKALSFILRFERMVKEFNDRQLLTETKINNAVKREYLENAVNGITQLMTVGHLEIQSIATGGRKYAYPQYVYALKTAATIYDSKRSRNPNRSANRHSLEIQEIDGDDSDDSDDSDDDNESPSIDTFAVMQKFFGATMDKGTWESITDNGKKTWDQLDSSDKAKILGYAKKRAENKPKARKPAPKSKRRIEANTHDVEQEADDSASEKETDDDAKEESKTVDANVHDATTEAKGNSHPADLRTMLSKKAPKAGDDKKKKVVKMRAVDVCRSDEIDDYLKSYWGDDSSDSGSSSEDQDFH